MAASRINGALANQYNPNGALRTSWMSRAAGHRAQLSPLAELNHPAVVAALPVVVAPILAAALALDVRLVPLACCCQRCCL